MKTRFAPSPTGPLHLGHVYAAFYAHDLAVAKRGEFHLRIEDIDQSRAKPHWEAQIFEDLNWLGLSWSLPVLRQSERSNAYDHALDQLWDHGLLYPCSCQRKDIHAAASAPQEGTPIYGPDGLLYPGTCRTLARPAKRPKAANVALRLDMAAALKHLNLQALTFDECGTGTPFHGPYTVSAADMCTSIGDVVLQRRDMGTSYHLSVVVDDA
ncbi:MAG: glutamate--tRNA ligase family protein, partial [Halocynthiibacter sp.]